MSAPLLGVNMTMKELSKFIFPVLKSQIAIFIYFGWIVGDAYLSKPYEQTLVDLGHMVAGSFLFSLIALIISIPVCLFIVLPILIILARYQYLNITTVLVLSLFVSSFGLIMVRELQTLLMTMPIGFIGGIICWNELRKKGILTSQETTPSARTRFQRARS